MKANVFLSYAHANNYDEYSNPGNGWVSSFAKTLERALIEKLGRQSYVKLWWDYRKLQGNQPIDDTIKEAILESDILVIVLSKAYLSSTYCLDELNIFLEKEGSNAEGKVFIAYLEDLSGDKLPDNLMALDAVGYLAYVKTDSGRIRPVGGAIPTNKSIDFYNCILDIVEDIVDVTKVATNSNNFQILTPEISQNTVFIADVTDDLEEKRDEIVRLCKQQNYRVWPEKEFSRDAENFNNETLEYLQRANLFVQLLGKHKGKLIPNEKTTYIYRQFETAQKSDLEILQWISPEISLEKISDPSHRELLNGNNVTKEIFEQFKISLIKKIEEINKPKSLPKKPVLAQDNEILPTIFISSSPRNLDVLKNISNALSEANFPVLIPAQDEQTASEMREDLRDNLLTCDGIIIVHDDNNHKWVEQQIRHVLRNRRLRESNLTCLNVYHTSKQNPDSTALSRMYPGLNFICLDDIFNINELEACKFTKQ